MSLTIQSSRFIHLALDCRIDLGNGDLAQLPCGFQLSGANSCPFGCMLFVVREVSRERTPG
jgi:hypothetical protein